MSSVYSPTDISSSDILVHIVICFCFSLSSVNQSFHSRWNIYPLFHFQFSISPQVSYAKNTNKILLSLILIFPISYMIFLKSNMRFPFHYLFQHLFGLIFFPFNLFRRSISLLSFYVSILNPFICCFFFFVLVFKAFFYLSFFFSFFLRFTCSSLLPLILNCISLQFLYTVFFLLCNFLFFFSSYISFFSFSLVSLFLCYFPCF